MFLSATLAPFHPFVVVVAYYPLRATADPLPFLKKMLPYNGSVRFQEEFEASIARRLQSPESFQNRILCPRGLPNVFTVWSQRGNKAADTVSRFLQARLPDDKRVFLAQFDPDMVTHQMAAMMKGYEKQAPGAIVIDSADIFLYEFLSNSACYAFFMSLDYVSEKWGKVPIVLICNRPPPKDLSAMSEEQRWRLQAMAEISHYDLWLPAPDAEFLEQVWRQYFHAYQSEYPTISKVELTDEDYKILASENSYCCTAEDVRNFLWLHVFIAQPPRITLDYLTSKMTHPGGPAKLVTQCYARDVENQFAMCGTNACSVPVYTDAPITTEPAAVFTDQLPPPVEEEEGPTTKRLRLE